MAKLTIDRAFELATRNQQEGRLREASALYRQILARQPDHAETLRMLGLLAQQLGQTASALELLRRTTRLKPQVALYHADLARTLKAVGRLDESAAAFRQAIHLRPDWPEACNDLGNVLTDRKHLEEAIAAYRQALALRPDFAEAWNNLGNAFRNSGQLDEAIAAYRQALFLRPDLAEAHSNLGNALKDTGELDEALASYRRAAEIKPDPRIAASILYALHLHPDCGPDRIYQEHVRWNQTYARPLAPSIVAYENDPSPDRRLRVGYVSCDFNEHPVGRFLLPLLAHHDHAQFEVFCYSDTRRCDAITERLSACADTWRSTIGLSDERLALLVCEDRIDILVDLTMHASGSRLLTFARKPAPVQVTYLAYCSTTGLETMDYRLTDPYLDPVDADERHYAERSLRLPHTYWCYAPPEQAPPVSPVPALAAGHVTFGCLNNYSKVTRPTLAAWRRILQQAPGSELIVHSGEGSHRQRVREYFASEGIEPRRLSFADRLPLADYFAQYRRIDIALDPFPFPGATTTCDALWMGVPVVSLAGKTAVSRAGLSVCSSVGLPELVARTPEQYVQIAAELARDLHRLAGLRATLRERMRSSSLMDCPRFARDIEAALRQIWRTASRLLCQRGTG